MLVLSHEIVAIPLFLAWDFTFDGWWRYAAYFTSFFWLADIFMSFLTGYIHDGLVEMRWKPVAMQYLKSWFWLDVPLVLMDIVFVWVSAQQSGAKFFRFAKVLRFLRVAGLVRAWRVMMSVENIIDRNLSDSFRAVTYMMKLLVAILGI